MTTQCIHLGLILTLSGAACAVDVTTTDHDKGEPETASFDRNASFCERFVHVVQQQDDRLGTECEASGDEHAWGSSEDGYAQLCETHGYNWSHVFVHRREEHLRDCGMDSTEGANTIQYCDSVYFNGTLACQCKHGNDTYWSTYQLACAQRGGLGESCSDWAAVETCLPGYVCSDSICRQRCDAESPCADGQQCVSGYATSWCE